MQESERKRFYVNDKHFLFKRCIDSTDICNNDTVRLVKRSNSIEATLNSPDAKDDPNYVSNFRQIWKEMLNQGLSVAAFTANPRGGKPLLAGANVLELNRKGHKYDFSHLEVISSPFVRCSSQRKQLVNTVKRIIFNCDK